MMCPPHRVKIVSTPSFFSALATRWPPETTPASRLLRCRGSSAVLDAAAAGVAALMRPASVSPGTALSAGTAGAPSAARRARGADRLEVPRAHRLEHEQ